MVLPLGSFLGWLLRESLGKEKRPWEEAHIRGQPEQLLMGGVSMVSDNAASKKETLCCSLIGLLGNVGRGWDATPKVPEGEGNGAEVP